VADFLTAAYALRLRELFVQNKDGVKKHTSGPMMENRKALVRYALPIVRKAYRTGVDFALTWVKVRRQLVGAPKPDYRMSPKTKNKLLNDFIKRLQFAEKEHRLKVEQQKELLKANRVKRNVTKGGTDALMSIYIGNVRKAINILIANAGEAGKSKVISEHYG